MADGDGWSIEELRATVGAYLDMLSHEQGGQPYSKAAYRRELIAGPLAGRTASSVEFRMQNISAAMDELCLPWIAGYRPARNVGNRIKDQIQSLLRDAGVLEAELAQPTGELEALEDRTATLRKRRGRKLLEGTPRGQSSPRRVPSSSSQFVRDPLVRAWVLEASGGACEACSAPAPFLDSLGQPYLEVHHVLTLAEGGPDTVENAVAVCPNCHRRLHLGADRGEVGQRVYERIARLRP